jgi:hypothetical protein
MRDIELTIVRRGFAANSALREIDRSNEHARRVAAGRDARALVTRFSDTHRRNLWHRKHRDLRKFTLVNTIKEDYGPAAFPPCEYKREGCNAGFACAPRPTWRDKRSSARKPGLITLPGLRLHTRATVVPHCRTRINRYQGWTADITLAR